MLARIPGALLLVTLASTAAAAQEPPPVDAERPPIVPTIEQKRVNLNLSLFDAYDVTTVTDTQPGFQTDPRLRQNGSFSGLSTSLSFTEAGHDHAFNAVAGGDLRYYSIGRSILPVDYFAGLNFSTRVSRHVSVRGGGNASYSPYYAFGAFLTPRDSGQIATPRAEQNVVRLDTFTSSASGGLVWSPTPKTSFDAAYTIDYLTAPAQAYRLRTQGAAGAFRHRVSRYADLGFGYAYRESETGLTTVPAFIAHDVNVGIGYHRPLSFSRRTVVGFDVGSTIVTQRTAASFFITGDASIVHQLNRTWTAALFYRRDIGTVGGVAIPFASHVGSGTLGGLWTKRLAFDLTGAYARGASAIAVSNGYETVTASSRLRYTLTRFLPVYIEYVYYHYRFDRPIGLAPGFPLLIDRQGLRGGLFYSVPLGGRRPPRS